MKIQGVNEIIKKFPKGRSNKIIGFTNGCYDLLHKGHIYNLKKCKSMCNLLIVGVNSNKSVKKNKGINRPIEGVHQRIKNLSKLGFIDHIIYFHNKTPLRLIKILKPDIIFKGSDYKNKKIVGEQIIKKYNGKIILIPLLKGYSTTKKIKQMKLKSERN